MRETFHTVWDGVGNRKNLRCVWPVAFEAELSEAIIVIAMCTVFVSVCCAYWLDCYCNLLIDCNAGRF